MALINKGKNVEERHHARHVKENKADMDKNLEAPELVVHKQEHIVAHEGVVTIHGGNFSVKDQEYGWHLKDPKGQDVPLRNTETSEPSFVAEHLGDYVATLALDAGLAQLTFHVEA